MKTTDLGCGGLLTSRDCDVTRGGGTGKVASILVILYYIINSLMTLDGDCDDEGLITDMADSALFCFVFGSSCVQISAVGISVFRGLTVFSRELANSV
jgi:hypothetical protein